MNSAEPETIRLLECATLRVAAWPAELVRDFAAHELAALGQSLERRSCRIRAASEHMAERLFEVIPRIDDPEARADLLDLRRRLRRSPDRIDPPSQRIRKALHAYGEVLAELQDLVESRYRLATMRDSFEHQYTAEIERQASHLDEIVRTPHFLKGLALANPTLFSLSKKLAMGRPRSPKTRRSTRCSLFRYLMRAIGRPTPNGLWAGIAPVCFEASLAAPFVLVESPRRYEVTVALEPFARAVEALARTPSYRHNLGVYLNPTAINLADRSIRWVSASAEPPRFVQMPDSPFLRLLLDYLADGRPRCIRPLLDAISTAEGADSPLRERLASLLELLLDLDLLRVDLRFNLQASSVWDALSEVIASLREPEKSLWDRTVADTRRLCGDLARRFDALTPSDFETILQEIQEQVKILLVSAGLPPALPANLVQVDLRMPFTVLVGRQGTRSATRAIREQLAFHGAEGLAEGFRRATASFLRDVTKGETTLLGAIHNVAEARCAERGGETFDIDRAIAEDPGTLSAIFERFPQNSVLASLLRAAEESWERRLGPVHFSRVITLPPAGRVSMEGLRAGGSALLELWNARQVGIGLCRPHPNVFSARFAAILGEPRHGSDGVLEPVRSWYKRVGRDGQHFVEVVTRDVWNMNAAVHPPLIQESLDLERPSSITLRDIHIDWGNVEGLPMLTDRRSARPRQLIPVYNSAAAVRDIDPASYLLFRLATVQGWEFLSFGVPQTSREIQEWRHAPRILLPDGGVLSRERWTVDESTVARIVAKRGLDRYLAWLLIADDLSLPELIFLQFPKWGNPLLIQRDSPLAVDSFFQRAPSRRSRLIIREFPGEIDQLPVVDGDGRHYLAELALSWVTVP